MATGFKALFLHDVRMQFRYGIYFAYAFVIAFYITILVVAGPILPDWAPALVIFTDPAILGFFFLGALMMLEKSENTRTALAITPISAAAYFWSKAGTLTLMALVAVTVLTFFLHESANWLMLVAIVAITSIQFLAIGIPAALHFQTVTAYLIGATGYVTPIIIPAALALYEHMPWWAIPIPPAAQFRLILVATGARTASGLEIALLFLFSAFGAIVAYLYATKRLETELGHK